MKLCSSGHQNRLGVERCRSCNEQLAVSKEVVLEELAYAELKREAKRRAEIIRCYNRAAAEHGLPPIVVPPVGWNFQPNIEELRER